MFLLQLPLTFLKKSVSYIKYTRPKKKAVNYYTDTNEPSELSTMISQEQDQDTWIVVL